MLRQKEFELMGEMVMSTDEMVRNKKYKVRQGDNQLIDAHAL